MKLLQLIKQAFVSSPGTDSKSYPQGQATYNGKTAKFVRLLPYGVSSLEPDDTFVLVLNSQGQEAVKFGIPSAMQNRLKGLKKGEAAIYNSLTGAFVILKEDGTAFINVDTKIDGDLHVTGDVQIDGELTVEKDTLIEGNATVVGNLSAAGITGTGNASITGNATITGSLTVTVDATIGGRSFLNHTHSGVQSGGSNTGPVV